MDGDVHDLQKEEDERREKVVNGLCHGLADGNGLRKFIHALRRGWSLKWMALSTICGKRKMNGGNPLCPLDISPKYDNGNLGCEFIVWLVEFGGDSAMGISLQLGQKSIIHPCSSAGLVVEVDGDVHDLQKEEDERREKVVNGLCHGLTDGNGLRKFILQHSSFILALWRGWLLKWMAMSTIWGKRKMNGGNPLCPLDISPKFQSAEFRGDLAMGIVPANGTKIHLYHSALSML